MTNRIPEGKQILAHATSYTVGYATIYGLTWFTQDQVLLLAPLIGLVSVGVAIMIGRGINQ